MLKKFYQKSICLSVCSKKKMGYELNLYNPQTFNEKLQWFKLHDRNPLYTTMVDKYEVKKYVADKIGEEYIIPTLGVWDHFDEIDFNKLPDKFVLKCTHDSGSIVLCWDKSTFDKADARRRLERGLARNYYYNGYEWPYKDVKPRIIAEKFMVDESGTDLKDYKIFNFHGLLELIQVDFNRFINHQRNMYDCDWQYLELSYQYFSDVNNQIKKPATLEKMLDLARKLSADIPFLRTDFYVINKELYFGELTFYPEAGMGKFAPAEWEKILGDKIHIEQLSAGGIYSHK